jgi:hypothetical protein
MMRATPDGYLTSTLIEFENLGGLGQKVWLVYDHFTSVGAVISTAVEFGRMGVERFGHGWVSQAAPGSSIWQLCCVGFLGNSTHVELEKILG